MRLLLLVLLHADLPSPPQGRFVEWLEPPAAATGSRRLVVLLDSAWNPPGPLGARLVAAPLGRLPLFAALELASASPGQAGLLAPDLAWRIRRRLPTRLLPRDLPPDTWHLALLEDPSGRMRRAWLLLRPSLHVTAHVHGRRALLFVTRKGRPVPKARILLLDRRGELHTIRTDESGLALAALRSARTLTVAEAQGRLGATLLERLPGSRACSLADLATSPAKPVPGSRLTLLGRLEGQPPRSVQLLLAGPGRQPRPLGEVRPSRTGLIAGQVTVPAQAAPGPAWLLTQAPDCTTGRVPLELQPGPRDPEHLALSLEPGFSRVRIQVQVERPWAGPPTGLAVRVSWGWRPGLGTGPDQAGGEALLLTDSEGRATLTLDWPALAVSFLWVRAEANHLGRNLAAVAWMPAPGHGLLPAGPGLWIPLGHEPVHLLDPKGRRWPCTSWPVGLCLGPREGPVASEAAGRILAVARRAAGRAVPLEISVKNGRLSIHATRPGLLLTTALCGNRSAWRLTRTGRLVLPLPANCSPEGLASLVEPSGRTTTTRFFFPRTKEPHSWRADRRRDATCILLEGASEWGLLFGAERRCRGWSWNAWASANGASPPRTWPAGQWWSCRPTHRSGKAVLLAALGPRARICGPPGPVAVASQWSLGLLESRFSSRPPRLPKRVRRGDRVCFPGLGDRDVSLRDLAPEPLSRKENLCLRVTGPHPRMASPSLAWQPELLPDEPPRAWKPALRPGRAARSLVVGSSLPAWALARGLEIARQPRSDLETAVAQLLLRLTWPAGGRDILPSTESMVRDLAAQVRRLRPRCDVQALWQRALAILALRNSNLGPAFGPASALQSLLEACVSEERDIPVPVAWSAALVRGRPPRSRFLPTTLAGVAAAIWAGLATDISLARLERLAARLDRRVAVLLRHGNGPLTDAALALLVARRFLPSAAWRPELAKWLTRRLKRARTARPLAVALGLYALASQRTGSLRVRCGHVLCERLGCRGELVLWPAAGVPAPWQPSFEGPCPGGAVWLDGTCRDPNVRLRIRWRETGGSLRLDTSRSLDRPCLLLSTPSGLVPDLRPPEHGQAFPVEWAATRPWGVAVCHTHRLPPGHYGLRWDLPHPAAGQRPGKSCLVAWPSACACHEEAMRPEGQSAP